MASEEEWRQKNYEEWVGQQGNSSMGTQSNQAGYNDYLAKQKRSSGGGGGGGGCFPQGVMVDTPFGKKDITALKIGELVCGMNLNTGNILPRKILKIYRHTSCQLWELVFDDGKRIRTTSVHSFKVERGWVRASSVSLGDKVLVIDNQDGDTKEKTVVSSKISNTFEDVYNLVIDKDFTFIADSAVVHSFTHLRNSRMAYWLLVSFFFNLLNTQVPSFNVKRMLRPDIAD